MNLLSIQQLAESGLKRIFFVLNWVRFSNPKRLTHWYPNIVCAPPPVSLKLAGLCTVNEQEDDSVIFQTNPFTNQSVVARKCDNWCELYRNVQMQMHVQSHRDTGNMVFLYLYYIQSEWGLVFSDFSVIYPWFLVFAVGPIF